jgi:hypothetical protein
MLAGWKRNQGNKNQELKPLKEKPGSDYFITPPIKK